MKINKCENINFGQKIPTSSLLKMGAGIFSYNDAMTLCKVFDNKFPGHVGYFKKAVGYAETVADKNENVKKMFGVLNAIESKEDKLAVIKGMVRRIGDEIDVIV